MTTLGALASRSYAQKKIMGIDSQQAIVNGVMQTSISRSHPIWYGRTLGNPRNQIRRDVNLFGTRKKVDAASTPYKATLATPEVINEQMRNAVQDPNSEVTKMLQQLVTTQMAAMNATPAQRHPQARAGVKRPAPQNPPTGADNPDYSVVMQQPAVETSETAWMAQFRQGDPNMYNTQSGGIDALRQHVPGAYYKRNKNTGEKIRMGGVTQGQPTWTGERMELRMRAYPHSAQLNSQPQPMYYLDPDAGPPQYTEYNHPTNDGGGEQMYEEP